MPGIQTEPTKLKWEKYANIIQKGTRAGYFNGIRVLVDIEAFNYHHTSKTHKLGAKVTIHHHLDVPISNLDGHFYSPGHEYSISVSPTLYNTTQRAISRFSPADRQCITESDVQLHLLKPPYRLSRSNCLFEAFLTEILKQCGCSPSFIPPLATGTTCQGTKVLCVKEVLRSIGTFKKV